VPAAVRDAERAAEGTVAVSLGRAAWHGSPGAGKESNFADALRHMDAAYTGTATSMALNTHARILFLNGRVREAQDLLSARGRRGNFETLFWLGATYWRLGRLSEARAVFLDARRRNSRLAEHAKRVEGLAAFVASIDRDLASEGGQGSDRGRLGFELATHLLTVAEIEVLVRRYLFDRAVAEYEKLLQAVTSKVRRGEIEARLPEVRSMAAAHRRLTAGINSGALKLKTAVGKSELTLVKAADGWFEFRIPAGEGRFPWACLDTDVYCDFAQKAGAEPGDLFGLGALAWDASRSALAGRLFEASAAKDPRQRPRIDAFLARRRGTSIPAGGYVWFRNQYVTVEEKGSLEKGLVRWEGTWVTAKDRDQLAKGRKKVGDAWVEAADADLMARGFRKVGGVWISPEDLAAKRSVWAEAWTEETAHFTIRTNESESFAKDLGVLAETAWLRLRETHGGAEPKLPKGEKLTLFAFRAYEDYRRHCIEQKAEDFLAAAGFARSDSNTVAGWNKTGNTQQFLQTMVHEAAHLYYFRVAPAGRPASWYSEGLASQLEGFRWDGKAYRFNGISEGRLPFARDAMKSGTHIPLEELFGGNALALINSDSRKALLFYAECWALVFWLSQTDDPKYRDAWSRYRKAVDAGGQDGPGAFLGDLRQVEKDWIRFITGL
ncbi:MAG: hypothetical protein HUU15_11210, partial [Candidatus Brocadiae bacterium]|nr:hypothetical protein [Candidatus Brocadiia bacterium]